MKKIILWIIILVVLGAGFYIYSQKAGQGDVATNTEVLPGAAGTAAISSDLDSISKEIASIDTSDSAAGDAITPITDADLASD